MFFLNQIWKELKPGMAWSNVLYNKKKGIQADAKQFARNRVV